MNDFENFELFDVLLGNRKYFAAAKAASYTPSPKEKENMLREVIKASLSLGDFQAAEYAAGKMGRSLTEKEIEKCITILSKDEKFDKAQEAIKKLPPKKREVYREIFKKIYRNSRVSFPI